MKRILILASVALIFAAASASAQYTTQLEDKTIPVGDFAGISVTSDFEVTLTKGPCVVKVTADKMLSPYVQVYVRGKVLYITYDGKSVPKDIRQYYKGKNAPKPVFRASVSLPELGSVSLSDNAVLNCADDMECRLTADIDLADKAQLKNLDIKANSVNVTLKKNAQAALSINAATKADVKTEGNSNLKAQIAAHDLVTSASGSSEIAVKSTAETATVAAVGASKTNLDFNGSKITVTMSGSADIDLAGTTEFLSLTGDKSSALEAASLETKEASVNLSGPAKANLTVSDSVDCTLVSGSTLYYTGNPSFKIGKILKSTLAPYGSNSK